jgi:hypothetical protein
MDLEKQFFEMAKKEIRLKIGEIRDPATGEFPVVVIDGDSLENMCIRVEGSPELMEIVSRRLASDDSSRPPESAETIRKVFLSYTSVDAAMAKRIAEAIVAAGIDTWWDQWEIKAGDSLRQKVDQGIAGCTHFIVLLTSNSIAKPWVNAEMDAAFVQRLSEACTFIPLRHNLRADALPPLLRGMRSPEIDDELQGIQQIINDIHGISAKPALGPPPKATAETRSTGYSPAATAIAKVFVEATEHGEWGDPQMDPGVLKERTELTQEDVEDALHELRPFVKLLEGSSYCAAIPLPALFSEFDKYWMPWNPEKDAQELASAMINDKTFPAATAEIAARLGWAARRLNPAISYLQRRDLAETMEALGTTPFIAFRVLPTAATRRYVRSRT